MAKTLNGIDVSEYQGEIDWGKVKNAGIDFAILRIGYGTGSVQKDACFEKNIQNAHSNGIFVGGYWYSYALSMQGASSEAESCLKIIEPYRDKITMPICYKYGIDSIQYASRHGGVVNRDVLTSMHKTFLDEIKKHGYYGAYYATPDFISSYINRSLLVGYDLWLSCGNIGEDSNELTPPYEMGIWQYTKKGRVEGIRTAVGMNVSFQEYRTPYGDAVKDGAKSTRRSKIYIVKAGDTLSSIAYRHGTTYRRLMARNHIKNPNLIFPGQRIIIE